MEQHNIPNHPVFKHTLEILRNRHPRTRSSCRSNMIAPNDQIGCTWYLDNGTKMKICTPFVPLIWHHLLFLFIPLILHHSILTMAHPISSIHLNSFLIYIIYSLFNYYQISTFFLKNTVFLFDVISSVVLNHTSWICEPPKYFLCPIVVLKLSFSFIPN